MGYEKQNKGTKKNHVSADYISVDAGYRGILMDLEESFVGTGRYLVPSIVAAGAVQGVMFPMMQAQAATLSPTDSAVIDSGNSMAIPTLGTSGVNGVIINSGGQMTVSSGGVVRNTTVNSSGRMWMYGGSASDTVVSEIGAIIVSAGGVISGVDSVGGIALYGSKAENINANSGSVSVVSGSIITDISATNTHVQVAGASEANNTTLNSGATLLLSRDSTANNTIINDGASMQMNGGSAISTTINSNAHINVGGGVAGYTVNNGGILTVAGGVASNSLVNSGVMRVVRGLADNTEIKSDANMIVYGGDANNTTISGGSMLVSSGSMATGTIVDLDGTMMVVGGSASNTTLNSGTMSVNSGGSADTTMVNNGGSMTLTDGSVTSTTVNGGSLTVSSGGLATITTIDNGGAMILAEGTASNTTVNSGTMAVTSGGSADITTVNSNGSMTLTSGSATNTNVSGGSLTVSAGGMASDNIIDLDGTMMVVGGSASNTTVNSGMLAVSSGGSVDTTTVNSGGSMTLADGSATNTTLSGGALAVSAGGLATSTTVDSGGSMTVSSGGAASSTDIINGGFVTVDGGSVTDTAISSGIMEVISNGLATDTTVYNGGSLSVTGNSTVNNVVLSGGSFTIPTAGTNAFISGKVSGDGNITGPGDFTLANGNILLNSGSISTTGKLTLNKVLDTTKPAVSATDFSVGKLDVTDLDTGTSTSGTLIKADTVLPAVTLTSGTDSGVLDSISTSVVFGGGAHTDTSIPGFTLDYTAPSATYSLTNSAKEIDYSLNGNKQATKLTFGSIPWKDSGALIDHATQFTDVEFSGADVNTVNIHFNNVASLQANKKMTLVSDFGTSVGTITGTKYTVGTTLQGYGKAELEGNNLVYKVETDSVAISGGGSSKNITAQEQTHNTLMGMTAGIAVINAGQNFIEQAADGWGDVRNTGEDGVAVFAAMGASKDRYETGSHIDLNAWNGIVGLGKSHNLEKGKFQWGGFVEHGSGKFSLSNAGLTGDGTSTYTGGGMSVKWTNKHDVYTEAGVRYGQIKDSASNILKDALGNYYGYNVNADYYGGYIGVGKIYRFGENRSLDIYGKFSHIHRDGVSFDAGGRYELDALQSNILRVGAKYGVKSGKVNWYGGLAYEHEFSGEATGKADGLPIRSASIKGGSLRLDLGASIKPSEKSPWTMRMGITGHTGKHRGVSGSLMLSCNF